MIEAPQDDEQERVGARRPPLHGPVELVPSMFEAGGLLGPGAQRGKRRGALPAQDASPLEALAVRHMAPVREGI